MAEPIQSKGAAFGDPVGRTLGEFVLKEKLGEGGFGAVYRADQPLLGREAVVKVLHARHAGRHDMTQRFLREAKLASKLDHPFAAHIYAFGAEPDGFVWIAMELVRGTPLDQLLRSRGPLPLDQAVPLVERLCEVLHGAHEQGIVHRDIKPPNVMVLSRAGRLLPKLLDFGIAKVVNDGSSYAAVTLENAARGLDDARGSSGRAEVDSGSETVDARLTSDGQVLGSPAYMAPEQWQDGAIGPHTDQYALAAMIYEILTGRRAFVGRTAVELAAAHLASRVAPMGPAFPEGVEAVLRRGFSPRPSQRFASVLELGAALRVAAGLATERAELPTIDATLRDATFIDAPQPVAESVAQLSAATSIHQAYDAMWGVHEALLRYVAMIAMAARAKLGPPTSGDSMAMLDALRALHKRGLSDEEWLALTRELLAPYVAQPEVHPVPELVTLCATGDDPFTTLMTRVGGTSARGSESDVRGQLERALPELERLLRATAFLADYPLVAMRRGRGQRWMGVRSPVRSAMAVAAPGLSDGQVLLLGADRAPTLRLDPLVQIGPPAPGASDEIYLLAGQGRLGARLVALPGGFERTDDSVWDWCGDQLMSLSGEQAAEPSAEGDAPYRGLAAFGTADARLFYGREREITEALNRLRSQPLLAVVGPSGAGKSSFVLAGLAPSLPDGWRVLAMRPGATPMAALRARLAREDAGHGEPAQLLERLAGAGTCVLVVDQLEELFTLCHQPAERAAFAEALASAAANAEGRVRVVVTLRADFLVRAEEEAALRGRLAQAIFLLGTPAQPQLVRIIVEPARRCGYDFDDPALAAEMAHEVAGLPSALPLLSFTAARLWELRDRQFKMLTRRSYQAMGGVAGALAQHAEATLAELSPDQRRCARALFRQLVTKDGTRAVLSRDELLEVLDAGPQGAGVIDKLIVARLLTVREGDDGDGVELAHEALLTAWPRLVEWRRDDAEGARLRDPLRAAARQWEERGRPGGLLWRDDALAELKRWNTHHGAGLTELDRAFLVASIAEESRGRRLRRALLAGAFAVVALAALAFAELSRRATASAAEARAQLLSSYEEQGRQAWRDGDPEAALAFLVEAYAGGRDGPGLRYLMGRARAALAPAVRVLAGHRGLVVSAQPSGDGRRVITAGSDGNAKIWDASTGALLVTLSGHTLALSRAELTPDGRYAITSAWDGSTRLWDGLDGHALAVLDRGGEGTWALARVLGPERAITATSERARIWRVPAGEPILTLEGHRAPISSMRTSGDGAVVVTVARDDEVRVWSAGDGRLLRSWKAPAGVRAVDVGQHGTRLAAVLADRATVVLDVASGRILTRVVGDHDPAVVALSPDDEHVLSGAGDGTVRLFDVADGATRLVLAAHTGPVATAQFSPDGRRLLTTSEDGTGRVWDLDSGHATTTLYGHRSSVFAQRFDGKTAVTAGYDGTARIWDTRRSLVRAAVVADKPIVAAALATDGAQAFTFDEAQDATTWRLADGAAVGKLHVPLRNARLGSFAPGGARLIAFTEDAGHEASLYDLAGARELAPLLGHRGDVQWAGFGDDGSIALTTAVADPLVRAWDATTGAQRWSVNARENTVTSAALSRDGAWLFAGGLSGDIERWRLPAREPAPALRGHISMVNALAIAPGDRVLASASQDRTAILWSVSDGRRLATLTGHRDDVRSIAFSADGGLVATGSTDRTVRIWDAASGALLDTVDTFRDEVGVVAFGASSALLMAASRDRTLVVWQLPHERATAAALRAELRLVIEQGRPVPRQP